MKDYRVTWEIDIFNAESPRKAAELAQHKQQTNRHEYWCGVFKVSERSGSEFLDEEEIDLDEEDQCENDH